jgi:hypothetical protein
MTDPAHSFTALDDAGLDGRIRSDLDQIAAAVRDHLGPSYRALVLGGGYGRGEGGSVVAGDRLEPYNDYDLFVVVEGVRRLDLAAMRADLRALGENSRRASVSKSSWRRCGSRISPVFPSP